MKRFVTSYVKEGNKYGGHVDAIDFEHAQALCDERGLGEKVDGMLMAVVSAENFSIEQANKMIAAYSPDDEPPDADEFD